MDAFRIRLKDEYRELVKKVDKLRSFLKRDSISETIGLNQYKLLCKQLDAMESYSSTLSERLRDLDMDPDEVLKECTGPMTREKVFKRAVDECLEEMYERSQPKDCYKSLCTEYEFGKIKKEEPVYDRYYLSRDEIEYVRDKYKDAYGFRERWHEYINILLRDLTEGGLKNGYEEDENGFGHRTAVKTPKLGELIGEENAAKVIDLITDIRDFYRFDREEEQFDWMTTLMTAVPTSNKKTVKEYWASKGKDIVFKDDMDKDALWELDEYGTLDRNAYDEDLSDDYFFDDEDD